MKRRTLLARGALAVGSIALGGCVERELEETESKPPLFDDVYDETKADLGVQRKFEIAEEAALRAEGEAFDDPEALRSYLEEQDLLVEKLQGKVEDGERVLTLEYADDSLADRGLMYSLGTVSGGYAALVTRERTAEKLEASIHDSAGDTFGKFEIATDLAERYAEGEITAATYVGTVADTVKSGA